MGARAPPIHEGDDTGMRDILTLGNEDRQAIEFPICTDLKTNNERSREIMELFTIHELKTNPDSFDSIDTGSRGTTTRLNDRGYETNDYVVLRRTKYTGEQMTEGVGSSGTPQPLEYTGKVLMCKITHVQSSPGLLPGWVVLSLDIMDRFPNAEGFKYLTAHSVN